MSELWDQGETVIRRATYRNAAGVLVDPDSVRVYVRPPSGGAFEGDVVHDPEVVGVYEVKIVADEPGRWRYRFESDIEQAEQEEGGFSVLRRRVPDPEGS